MDATKDALADVFDTEKDFISNDFVTEHLDDIKKAAEGDAEAIDKLRDALAHDMILNIAMQNNLSDELTAQLRDQVNKAQELIPDIKVGASIDMDNLNASEQEFFNAMGEIIEGANMTAEQANAMFSTMGFQANFATEEKPGHLSQIV
jgi:hypothetical protein